jgi:hypothetical protein
MTKKISYLFLFTFLFFPYLIQAQYESNVTYGLKFGGIHTTISNLPEMIIGRNNSLENFTLENKGTYGVEGGLFLNYKLSDSRAAIQPELLYRTAGEKVSYKNTIGKEYELSLNYTYLVIGALYKSYPLKGLNIGFGAFYGINLTSDRIEYKSNEEGGLYDVSTRQFYRDGLAGKDDFSMCFGLGYEFKKSIHFDMRYYFGVSDVVKSSQSSFQFIENKNRSSILSFSIGYSLHEW